MEFKHFNFEKAALFMRLYGGLLQVQEERELSELIDELERGG